MIESVRVVLSGSLERTAETTSVAVPLKAACWLPMIR
jgi:hypothetical protein